MRQLFHLACLAAVLSIAIAYGQTREHEISDKTPVSLVTSGQSLLRSIIQLGAQESVPIGIVFDTEGGLCKQHQNINLPRTTLSQVMNTILSGSNYSWQIKAGVVEIRPQQVPESTRRVLEMTFDRFGTIKTTIQGMGIILSGQIFSRIHPGQGYAGNILSSVDAEEVPPFELLNVSTEEILNHIISTGSKGVWILYPPTDTIDKNDTYGKLRTYGYKDDLSTLRKLPCTSQ